MLAERVQRVAVLRAVKGLACIAQTSASRLWKANMARGAPVVFYRQYRVLSYATARLKGDIFSFKRWQSEDELRTMLSPGGDHHYLIDEAALVDFNARSC